METVPILRREQGEPIAVLPLMNGGSVEDCPHWYAAYTNSRHEKRVAQQLEERRIACFLPLYHSVRRWKDRQKQLDLPLFPGYVFVQIPLKDRLRVLDLAGVAAIVSFNGKPAPVPEDEIEGLRKGLGCHTGLRPHPYLKTGRRVRIRSGAMAGLEGILVRRKERDKDRGTLRLVLSVSLLMRSVALEVDEADVEPLL
jgi:transcription antitermination factor NusG